ARPRRNRSVRFNPKPPRAPRVRLVALIRILLEIHSNFVQYTPQSLSRAKALWRRAHELLHVRVR
ncbi:MAG: hypothetical protein M3P22_00845, partial [bacterium]|nr:hypothetical protein [bacterium]